MLKKLLLPSAVIYTILLTVVSLITLRDIPSIGTDFDDKLYHVLAYVILTVIWFLAIDQPSNTKTTWKIIMFCILFGIIIEAIQGKVNVNRAGDFLDVGANVIGVFLGAIYCFNIARRLS